MIHPHCTVYVVVFRAPETHANMASDLRCGVATAVAVVNTGLTPDAASMGDTSDGSANVNVGCLDVASCESGGVKPR